MTECKCPDDDRVVCRNCYDKLAQALRDLITCINPDHVRGEPIFEATRRAMNKVKEK